jgi:hypothetical protein
MPVLIGSHQLMAEEPPTLEEEAKQEDVSKESVETAAKKATWNETVG